MSAGKGIPTASPPTAYQHKDKDHSTTHSAVEEGVIIIRDKDKQQQDINTLSRDTQNANNELAPIFDKQKELDRIEKIELVADIASQAKDLAQKYSRMQAEEKYKSAQEKYNALTPEEKALADKAIEEDLKKHGIDLSKYDEKDRPAVIRDEYIRQTVQREGIGNMGDGFSKGIDAATSIVIGIIKGDITGGLAGASAPYLATLIKEQTGHYDAATQTWITDNKEANLVAHAILGAVVAELQGNSGLSGGIGALTGEVAAEFMAKQIYGKDVKDLTEAEKRNISALAQLASGLAVASVGGNTGDISAAIASSKNAAENNWLSPSEARGKAYVTWIKVNYLHEELTEDDKLTLEFLEKRDKERDQFLKDNCTLGNISSPACQNALVEAWAAQAEYDSELNYRLKVRDQHLIEANALDNILQELGLTPENVYHLQIVENIARETNRNVVDVLKEYRLMTLAQRITAALVGGYLGVKGTTVGKGNAIPNNINSSLKLGETKVINEVSVTRVGRWMSPEELAKMQSTGKIVQGGGGQTFISINGVNDFKGAAPKGSVYVEFDVPTNSLIQGGKDGWYKMLGPDAKPSQQHMLNKQGGSLTPNISNINVVDQK